MNYLEYTNMHKDVSGKKRLDFIIKNVKKINPKKTIDVGCGTGSVTIPLGFFKFNILGIDVDEKSIEIAKNRNKFENVKFQVKDIKDINEKYDLSLSMQVLEHLNNPGEMMKEMARISNNAIITIPNGYGPSEVMGRMIGKIRGSIRLKSKTKTNEGMFTANYDNPHVQKFTIKQMKELAKKSGWKIKEIRNHNFILGTFPFNQLFFHTPFARFFEKIDNKIADILPHFMASGWYFRMKK